ncbi:MAG: anthranilate phosphoribosyltransferase [bacterium]
MSDNFMPSVRLACSGVPLTQHQMQQAITLILENQASPEQLATFLTALKIRGETIEEITAAANVMREKSTRFTGPSGAIDTCGTGGDGANTYNISTAVAFVLAGCGLPVAKHGNKAASSMSGAADILTELGVHISAGVETAQQCLAMDGICFLFAPMHHSAMKHVAPTRKAMGVRTLFNLLGPLTNPACAEYQLLGVYDSSLMRPLAAALKSLGSKAAWIVHGSDGLDELTLTGPSHVCALSQNGAIKEFTITPEEAGLLPCSPEALRGGSPAENAAALRALLAGAPSAYRDIVLLNAAAGLIIADRVETLKQGVTLAAKSIDNGMAQQKLTDLIKRTNAA